MVDAPEPTSAAVIDADDRRDEVDETSRKKRRMESSLEDVLVRRLPDAELYERSFMHRDNLTNVLVVQKSNFLLTGSRDGVVKFWRKRPLGIEFVKQFRGHVGPITHMAASPDGKLLATISSDKTVKIFDIVNFDMINVLPLDFVPSLCCFVFSGSNSYQYLAIVPEASNEVLIFNSTSTSAETAKPQFVLNKIHGKGSHILSIAYNERFGIAVSTDSKGMIEYWNTNEDASFQPFGHGSPLQFQYKSETDLYAFAKAKTTALTITMSPDGKRFVTTGLDKQIRVFNFLSGKLVRQFDESAQVYTDMQKNGKLSALLSINTASSGKSKVEVDEIDFGRRLAVEKAIDSMYTDDGTDDVLSPASYWNAVFDESGHYLMYATMLGIKVVNLDDNRVVRIIGSRESSDRFMSIALFQGKVDDRLTSLTAADSQALTAEDIARGVDEDPVILSAAFRRSRFYLFTRREPDEGRAVNTKGSGEANSGRDVFNEKPTKEEAAMAAASHTKTLFRKASIHTTMGDIQLILYPDLTPKTVENFCSLAKSNYFDNVIFHRVIRGFMVQTGDPTGNGTGGESIWGCEFEDEFHPSLRHDQAFTVSMANAGPNTNGSQFFITTVPTPWLDNKHSVFGRVIRGQDVVQQIENLTTGKDDKPLDEVSIINVDVTEPA